MKGGALVAPEADVYAIGVIGWEVLTGATAWVGDEENTIIESVKEGDRPGLSDGDWRTRVAKRLVTLVEECWMQDYASRPTCDAIGTAFEDAATALSASDAAKKEDTEIVALNRAREAEAALAAVLQQQAELERAQREARGGITSEEAEALRDEIEGLRIAKQTAEAEKADAFARARQQSGGDAMLKQLQEQQQAVAAALQQLQAGQAAGFGQVIGYQQREQQQIQILQTLLGQLALGELECPRVPWMQPEETGAGISNKMVAAAGYLRPKRWITDKCDAPGCFAAVQHLQRFAQHS